MAPDSRRETIESTTEPTKEPTKESIKFSILIPAFNEESIIVRTVQETIKVLEDFSPDYEIIIINDGSTDNTASEVADFIGNNSKKVRLEGYFPNQGKGYALKYGTGLAGGKYVLFMDADLDLHPSLIIKMYKIMEKSSADIVIGSKMHKQSRLNYPLYRRFLSSSYYFIIKVLFRLPIKDTQTGIKLFRNEVLKKCMSKVTIKKYAYDLELLLIASRNNYRIFEAPVQLKAKRDKGRIRLKDAATVFTDTMRVFCRLYFSRRYK
ncbi:MAG: putative glycosyltransferase CsbB [Actinobacteria bacterium ADurb.Bin346]|nr:MAG: putative glycosyltransferase CsbB [Actinobacteria bacterium ADurb.Bin346]